MPKIQTAQAAQASGETETPIMMFLSDAVKAFHGKTLADALVIVIPDTGKAQFNGSHDYIVKSGKDKGETKRSKATFVIAELGSSFSGVSVEDADGRKLSQAKGDVDDLPLSIKLTVIATPPNREGTTIAEALNRKPVAVESVKAA